MIGTVFRAISPRFGLVMVAVVAAIGVIPGCSLVTDPLPPNAERFAPPAIYSRWWSMTEGCSGVRGNFSAVHWYHVPGSGVEWNGQETSGLWQSADNRIVIADTSLDEGSVVRHEMLHALLSVGGHPRVQFLSRCASLVACTAVCATDGGHWRAPAPFVVLAPDSLVVSQQITVLPPEADGARWLSVLVKASNPTSRAVVVAPPAPLLVPRTFLSDIRVRGYGGVGQEQDPSDSSQIYFAPLETKQWLYEFRVASFIDLSHVRPGVVFAWMGYARHRAPQDSVTVPQ